MISLRQIKSKFKAPISKEMGPSVKQVIPSAAPSIEPFVFFDHFGPLDVAGAAEGVPPHPHAGIATITYLIEGQNLHRDSQGNHMPMKKGDLLWMTAGKGIIHAEGKRSANAPPFTIHGLQIWISLKANQKFSLPKVNHYLEKDIPKFQFSNSKCHLICGELDGKKSPVKPNSPAYIYLFECSKDDFFEIPIQSGYTCGLYLIKGSIGINEREIKPLDMVQFDEEGNAIEIDVIKDSMILVMGGELLNEPQVAYGPFVMNTMEQVHQVNRDYQMGRMGSLK